jgi:hypothetical protein
MKYTYSHYSTRILKSLNLKEQRSALSTTRRLWLNAFGDRFSRSTSRRTRCIRCIQSKRHINVVTSYHHTWFTVVRSFTIIRLLTSRLISRDLSFLHDTYTFIHLSHLLLVRRRLSTIVTLKWIEMNKRLRYLKNLREKTRSICSVYYTE